MHGLRCRKQQRGGRPERQHECRELLAGGWRTEQRSHQPVVDGTAGRLSARPPSSERPYRREPGDDPYQNAPLGHRRAGLRARDRVDGGDGGRQFLQCRSGRVRQFRLRGTGPGDRNALGTATDAPRGRAAWATASSAAAGDDNQIGTRGGGLDQAGNRNVLVIDQLSNQNRVNEVTQTSGGGTAIRNQATIIQQSVRVSRPMGARP